MPFDQPTRNLLARFVGDARTLLTEEFTRQLQQEYGLDPERGEVTDLGRLEHLDDARRATALLLRETLAYYLAGQPKPDAKARREALDRLVREQAFTILNRLCALRMAEGRGLLIESLGQGYRSKGFQLYSHLASTSLGETGDAYRCYLLSLFDELALELFVLFDRYAAESRLFPREAALSQVLVLINAPEIAPLWAEDETIGWIYQYFNSVEERRQMRAESAAPRNSRELAVRNQFFTPRYVVEFLTDNTLGRIWYEMTRGETDLKESCRYLVHRPTEIFLAEGEEAPQQDQSDEDLSQEELLRQPVYIPYRPLRDPRDILMLDPACGSLHFGLYAFDLYERVYDEAWELEGTLGPTAFLRSDGMLSLRETYREKAAFLSDVPRLIIERSIHGIDIDPRAVQIAGLSLWLRAQRSWQAQDVKPQDRPQIRRSNIVCAEPMPGDRALLEEFLKTLRDERLEGLIRRVLKTPAHQRVRATLSMADALCDLVRTVWKEMELAAEAGSLLKIEEALADAVARGRAEWDEKAPLFRVVDFGLTEQVDSKPTLRYYKTIPGEGDADFWTRAEALLLAALQDYSERAENGGGYRRRLFADDAARGFAFIHLSRKRFDVILMNPPFGESVAGCKNYLAAQYDEAISDIGMMFVSCLSMRLTGNGRLGAITNRTCLATSQLERWRRVVLLDRNPLGLVADLGYGVLDGAMVEACAYVITGDKASAEFVGFRLLESREKSADLLALVNSWRQGSPDSRAQLGRHEHFRRLPLAVISYWAPLVMLHRVTNMGHLGEMEPGANDGGHTGDDFRFVRAVWEVSARSIGRQVDFVFFAKGGEYSPMWDDVHLLEYWRSNGREIRQISGARIYHEDLHFEPGLTYPLRTTSDFSPRVLPKDCIFSTGGHGIHFRTLGDTLPFLGISYTRVAKVFVEILFGGGDASVSGSAARNYTAGTINMLPLPELDGETNAQVSSITCRLISAFRRGFASDETSRYFTAPPIADSSRTLASGMKQHLKSELARFLDIASASALLEECSFEAFALKREDVEGTVALVYGRHPNDYEYRDVTMELPPVLDLNLSSLMNSAAESCGGRNRSITKKSFFVDRVIDLASHVLHASPKAICESWAQTLYIPAQAKRELMFGLLQYVIGCAMGRWDIRQVIGVKRITELPDPFAPLPACSPGMLQSADRLPASPADITDDYPLRISWYGILVDDTGHAEDIEARVRDVLRVIWPTIVDGVEAEACEILDIRTLREYFAKPSAFFADHLMCYSRSRRQAPVYWPLSMASGSYTLWLYYHRLSDQMLYTCVNDFVDPKLRQVSDEAGRLRQKRGRSSADEKELEQLAGLELELTTFRAELLRIAAFWKPNLNDGVQITAAPLWRLFQHRPWQKTLKETWEKLEAGEYDWAHLAMSIWPERVVPKCVTDRSLAIAHDVEDLFWVEDGGRWRNLNPPEEELAEQVRRQHLPGRDLLRSGLAALTLGEGRGLRCEQVYETLATGKWDDLAPALLLWPERVAQRCWDDPLLAVTLKIDLPTKRTKAARERFITERVAAGCPDLADALREALADRVDRFASLWTELARGDRDELALALALWPDRVVDECAKDAELAELHGVRRFLWVHDLSGVWGRRKALKEAIASEIARRQRKGA